jgi:hypothetical protein
MTIMADKSRDFESMLADTNPVRLGSMNVMAFFLAPMEVLHFILTGDRLRIPLVHGRLGQALYSRASFSGARRLKSVSPTNRTSACSACANMLATRAAASSTAS